MEKKENDKKSTKKSTKKVKRNMELEKQSTIMLCIFAFIGVIMIGSIVLANFASKGTYSATTDCTCPNGGILNDDRTMCLKYEPKLEYATCYQSSFDGDGCAGYTSSGWTCTLISTDPTTYEKTFSCQRSVGTIDNSYPPTCTTTASPGDSCGTGKVYDANMNCVCKPNYVSISSSICVLPGNSCGIHKVYNNAGECVCASGGYVQSKSNPGECVTPGTSCGTNKVYDENGNCVDTNEECQPGTYYSGGQCITCQAGSYCPNGYRQLCPAGYYCPAGSIEPIKCSQDHYCPSGSASPVSCPAGFPHSLAGSENASDCTKCSTTQVYNCSQRNGGLDDDCNCLTCGTGTHKHWDASEKKCVCDDDYALAGNTDTCVAENYTCVISFDNCADTVVKRGGVYAAATTVVKKNGTVVSNGAAHLSSLTMTAGGNGARGNVSRSFSSLSGSYTVVANDTVGGTIDVTFTATLKNGVTCSVSKSVTVTDCTGNNCTEEELCSGDYLDSQMDYCASINKDLDTTTCKCVDRPGTIISPSPVIVTSPSPTETSPSPTSSTEVKKCYMCTLNGNTQFIKAPSASVAASVATQVPGVTASNCSVVADNKCTGESTASCYECTGGSKTHVWATSPADAKKQSGGSSCKTVRTDLCNSVTPPPTGTVAVIIAWVVGLTAIVYSLWYFKKLSTLK